MTPDDEIEQLSTKLGLMNEKQDWGIANADFARTDEFIRCALEANLTLAQQYAMTELVLASVNEAMLEGRFTQELKSSFSVFLRSELHGLPDQIRYWSKLSDHREFPLASFLKI